MSEISERATGLLWLFRLKAIGYGRGEVSDNEFMEAHDNLQTYIASLEAEVAELRPFRDGFDPKVTQPKEGVHVITANDDMLGWSISHVELGKWHDSRAGYQKKHIVRWFPLPQSRGDE